MLVTVGDSLEVTAMEPRWLDLVRWDTCRVDAAGARDGDEALQCFERRLERRMSEVQRPAAGDAGRVPRGDRGARTDVARPAHRIQEVRRASLDAGSGRVWVEKVVFKTTPPAAPGVARGDAPWPS